YHDLGQHLLGAFLQGALTQLEFGVDLQACPVLQLIEFRPVAPGDQHVAFLQYLGARRPDLLIAADQFQYVDAELLAKLGLAHRAADQRGIRHDPQLGDVLAQLVMLHQLGSACARQQPAAQRQQVETPGEEADDPQGGEFEHGDAGMPQVVGHGIDQQVGGGAGQGTDAGHLGYVGEGDQRLGGGHAEAGRGGHDDGHEYRHYRGIVDEGGYYREYPEQCEQKQEW